MRIATPILAVLITSLSASLTAAQSGTGAGGGAGTSGAGAGTGGGVDATGTASAGNRIATQGPQAGLRSQLPFSGLPNQNLPANGTNAAGAGAGPNSQRGPTAANNPPGFTGTTPFATGQGATSPAGGKNAAGVATGLNPQNTANAGGTAFGSGSTNPGAPAGINGTTNQPAARTTAPAGGAAPLQAAGQNGVSEFPRSSAMAAEQRALQQQQQQLQLNGNPQLQGTDDRSAQWRFKRHNGEWWYYGADSAWQYHRGGAWNRYDQANFTYPAGYRALDSAPVDDGVRHDIDPYDKQELQQGTSAAVKGPLDGAAAAAPGNN